MCCCAVLLFGGTLDRLERIYDANSSFSKSIQRGRYYPIYYKTHQRYLRCLAFLKDETLTHTHLTEEIVRVAKKFHRALLTYLNLSGIKKEDSVFQQTSHRYCYSFWKLHEIRDDITENLEVIFAFYAERAGYDSFFDMRLEFFQCAPFYSILTLELNQSDLDVINNASEAAGFSANIRFQMIKKIGLCTSACELSTNNQTKRSSLMLQIRVLNS